MSKIKLIIFDLDGVLADSRELHYQSLNMALGEIDPKYVIYRDEHFTKYDGLPTKEKLKLLTKEKGLPVDLYEKVWKMKQEKTIECIKKKYKSQSFIVYDDV